ncbi:hypothetical protein CK215_24795 [Mesorhizobium sp. WSM3864]|nr:hypothetical protein CK215_24795 [Mesorhizobium sp. WSM3864]
MAIVRHFAIQACRHDKPPSSSGAKRPVGPTISLQSSENFAVDPDSELCPNGADLGQDVRNIRAGVIRLA